MILASARHPRPVLRQLAISSFIYCQARKFCRCCAICQRAPGAGQHALRGIAPASSSTAIAGAYLCDIAETVAATLHPGALHADIGFGVCFRVSRLYVSAGRTIGRCFPCSGQLSQFWHLPRPFSWTRTSDEPPKRRGMASGYPV